MTTRHTRAQRSVAHSATEAPDLTELATEVASSWNRAMASGLACYESWLKAVSTPFTATLGLDPSQTSSVAADGERRAGVLPWMPKLETQVIPLRRATDPPGAEGSRITMRLAMPPVFGASAVSIDTLMPLPTAAASERDVPTASR